MKSRRGFTLLEMVMALGLMALVLVAMNTFLFSMGELWGRQSETRLFDLHVRALTRHLQRELDGVTLPQGRGFTFAPKSLRLAGGSSDYVFTFQLPAGSRILPWSGGRPLPDVEAGLVCRESEGLILAWHSQNEERFDDAPPRELVLSPWVTALQFDYYDESFRSWRTERTLRHSASGTVESPSRLRLTFSYDGMKREAFVALPAHPGGISIP